MNSSLVNNLFINLAYFNKKVRKLINLKIPVSVHI